MPNGDREEKIQTISGFLQATLAPLFAGLKIPAAEDAVRFYLERKREADETLERVLSEPLKKLLEDTRIYNLLPQTVREFLDKILQPSHQYFAAWVGSIGNQLLGSWAQAVFGPYWTNVSHKYLKQERPNRLPPDVVASLWKGKWIDSENALEELAEQGWDDSRSNLIKFATGPFLPLEIILYKWLRGDIRLWDYEVYMGRQGYTPEEAHDLMLYNLDRLSPDVLIRGFWRGVISSDEFLDQMQRNGLSARASWNFLQSQRPLLPPSDVITALWRGLISRDSAQKMIAGQGYLPGYFPLIEGLNRPLPTPSVLVSNYFRGYLSDAHFYSLMAQQGYLPQHSSLFLQAATQLLDPYQIRDLYLRNEINDDQHDRMLTQMGFTFWQIPLIKKLYYYIPSVSDLVRMAVREAWRDDIAARYGYDEEFPEEFALWAERQGLSREWARRYWRAHWDMPSPTMAYEMLQRGIIEQADAETLLKIADYPKYWRDKMIKVAYRPYTRVDIRRMYQMGILKEPHELLRAYQDLGYDLEHALNLTAFTMSLATEEERDLTRSDVLSAYADGTIDKAQAKEMLLRMGYDDDESDLLIIRQERQLIKDRRADIRDLYRKAYISGVKSEQEVLSELIGMGWQLSEVRQLLDRWVIEKQAQAPVPGVDTLISFYTMGIIEKPEQLRLELARKGMAPKYIDWYVKYADKQKARRR